jgi:hypothetical protein
MSSVKVTQFNLTEGGNMTSHRKEKNFYRSYVLVGITDGSIKEFAEVKLYATASRIYACAWIHGQGQYGHGSGYAGGYGYDKSQAAAHKALTSAGVAFDFPHASIDYMLLAIADCFTGVSGWKVIHGNA